MAAGSPTDTFRWIWVVAVVVGCSLVPLCNVHDVGSVLFTVRTNIVGTHKGQVSFPGGHRNDGERSHDTAAREAFEELGIAPSSITVLGTFHDVIASTPQRC